jgi:Rrf2 family transcriptional regulator, nitric oxide-sensitive transcriptional repressor
MISQTVEYALRAMVCVAEQLALSQKALTSAQLAKVTKVPPAYLAKVLKQLAQAGLIDSQRGVGGGFVLARKPEDVTILDIVNAVEPVQRIRTCPLGLSAHGIKLCPLHRRLDDAMVGIERAFGETTLQEILSDPNPSVPLCNFPRPSNAQAKNLQSID